MYKHKRIPGGNAARHPAEAHLVAESMRADFAKLVSVFDHQLANVCARDDRARSHIMEAKEAARRGLELSAELIELLQSAEAKS